MAAQRRRKGGEVESDYIKYLKYKNTGFQVSASDKTLAWWPTKDADRAFCHVEVTKDDGKNFTVRLENGEVLPLFTSSTSSFTFDVVLFTRGATSYPWSSGDRPR